jgi:hypothetical protein
MKREKESINLRAKKMMRGRIKPHAIPIVGEGSATNVHVIRQTTTVS